MGAAFSRVTVKYRVGTLPTTYLGTNTSEVVVMKNNALILEPHEINSLRVAAGIGAEVEGESEAVASAEKSTSVLDQKTSIVYQAL